MARKNDLEVSPAQAAKAARHLRARAESLSRKNDNDRANTGENITDMGRLDYEDLRHNGATDRDGLHDEELGSDDADVLAGMINDASLSGANMLSIKSADRTLGSTLGQTINNWARYWTRSPKKPTDSLGGNDNPTGQTHASQTQGKQTQVQPQKTPNNLPALRGDKTGPDKSSPQPRVIDEALSKMPKTRPSGLPDPYDIPQSPPRSPAPEPRPTTRKRQIPKNKREITRNKRGRIVMAIEVAPSLAEEDSAEPQELLEDPNPARRPILTSEEPNTTPKRASRSTRPNDPDDLGGIQLQQQKRQPNALKEPREHLKSSYPIRSWVSMSKSQHGQIDTENRAGLPAVDLAVPHDDLQGRSKTKTRSNDAVPPTRMQDTQPKEKVHVTPTKWLAGIDGGSAQKSAQAGGQGISPIISIPTPAKINPDLRRLQRPSQRSSLVPNMMQVRKSHVSAQQLPEQHPQRSLANARMPENAHGDASDGEDENQSDSDNDRMSTPRATVSDKYGATSFIEGKTLEHLRSIIKMAGEKDGKRVVLEDDICTPNGRILSRGVTRLISKYTAMKDLGAADVVDVGKFDAEHRKALDLLENIRKNTQIVLTDRLGRQKLGGRNADPESRSRMLKDLYLFVIPGLVEALYCAVYSLQDRKTLEISDMEECYAILTILHSLVESSRAEPKTIQPKAPTKNSYSISQPTRILRPLLHKLHGECGGKLAATKTAMRAERFRKALPDRAMKRKERLEAEERDEEEQFQQRLNDRNKAIIASLNERRAELGMAPCSQMTGTPFASQQPQTQKHGADEPSDDFDFDQNERLRGVFGSKNSHPGITPEEWTVDEMKILVSGLRRDRGPSRYEKLAAKLERTLDEIFDRAKYLKMQMEYTLKRLQEENPEKVFSPIKPWIENIGSEGFLNQ